MSGSNPGSAVNSGSSASARLIFTVPDRVRQFSMSSTNDVGSVVGGARLATEAAQTGAWDFLLELFVSFNLFVGILNLLPLPPLDGGHLAVVVAEKLTRRKVDPRALIPLTALVAGFLVLLMISLVYLDIVNPIPNPFR